MGTWGEGIKLSRRRLLGICWGRLLGARPGEGAAFAAAFHFSEDHFSGAGLNDTGDSDLDFLVQMSAPLLDDNHRAVLEIADTLARGFAGLDEADGHPFAGQYDGFQGVGQIIEIDDVDAAKIRDLVQVEIVGQDASVHFGGEVHKLGIDIVAFFAGSAGGVVERDFEPLVSLEAL